jgi:hypothetical protein
VIARPVRLFAAAAGAVTLTLSAVAGASAHEHRTIGAGAYLMRVGWSNEPAFTGVRNAVQLFLSDSANKPVTDLGDTLKVQVAYQGTTSDPLSLSPAFGATFGTPGEYDSPLLPTRPGVYTFHVTGAIHGTPVGESFTSSPTTFDSVKDETAIEFPVKDPSRGDLSTGVQRLVSRVAPMPGQIRAADASARRAQDAANRATVIGAVALVLVLLAAGGVLLLARRRVRTRR